MPIVLFAILGLVAVGVVATRRSRAAVLARLRVTWGQPVERERQMGAIAASHRARLAYVGSGASLDTRTWEDLNLEVFERCGEPPCRVDNGSTGWTQCILLTV